MATKYLAPAPKFQALDSTGAPLSKEEKARVRAREWLKNNRERNRLNGLVSYQKNKEERKAKSREWYKNNRERAVETRKIWGQSEKAKQQQKAYRDRHPERVHALSRNYKARKKNAIGSHSEVDVLWLFRTQLGKCVYCKCNLSGYHVDHIVPLVSGGTNDKYNLQLLCKSCNLSKGHKDPIVFAQKFGMLL